MRQVVSLIGLNAGQKIWMHPHEADAAIATGVAVLPEEYDAPKKSKKKQKERTVIAIKRGDDGMVLEGGFPKRAILPPKLLNSSMVKTWPSGTVQITIGDDVAVYDAESKPDSGELHINLREIVGAADDVPVVVNTDTKPKKKGKKKAKVAKKASAKAKVKAEAEAATKAKAEAEAKAKAAEEADAKKLIDDEKKETVDAPEDDIPTESVIDIPDDWEKMHWRKRVSLARTISGLDVTKADQANEVILEYVTRPISD